MIWMLEEEYFCISLFLMEFGMDKLFNNEEVKREFIKYRAVLSIITINKTYVIDCS